MKPANDKGPTRYIAQRAIDIRELAEQFCIDEDSMRAFCLEHEQEIAQAALDAAAEFVEEFGKLQGLIPLESAEPPELWDQDATCDPVS